MYLNTSTNKNHTITSNVNNAWYDMVSSSTCLISIEPPAWYPFVHRLWCQVHGASVVKHPAVPHNLPFDHIISHAPLQNKVRRFYFMFAIFTWLLGLSHKNRFLPTNMKPQRWLTYCCFESPLRALCCRHHIHYSWRNWHPTSHLHGISRTSVVEPILRRSMRKVGHGPLLSRPETGPSRDNRHILIT
jgi:hypothetical protein